MAAARFLGRFPLILRHGNPQRTMIGSCLATVPNDQGHLYDHRPLDPESTRCNSFSPDFPIFTFSASLHRWIIETR